MVFLSRAFVTDVWCAWLPLHSESDPLVARVLDGEAQARHTKTQYYSARLKQADQGSVGRVEGLARFICPEEGPHVCEDVVLRLYLILRWMSVRISVDVDHWEEWLASNGGTHHGEVFGPQSPEDVAQRGSGLPYGICRLFAEFVSIVAPTVGCTVVNGRRRNLNVSVVGKALQTEGGLPDDAWVVVHHAGQDRVIDVVAFLTHYSGRSRSAAPLVPGSSISTQRVEVCGYSVHNSHFMVAPHVASWRLIPTNPAHVPSLADLRTAVKFCHTPQTASSGASQLPSDLNHDAVPVVYPRFYAHGLRFTRPNPPAVLVAKDGRVVFNLVGANNSDVVVTYELWQCTDADGSRPIVSHAPPSGDADEAKADADSASVTTDDAVDQLVSRVHKLQASTVTSMVDSRYLFKVLRYEDHSSPLATDGTSGGEGSAAQSKSQQWVHELCVKFPAAGTYQLRVLSEVPSRNEGARVAAVFGVTVAAPCPDATEYAAHRRDSSFGVVSADDHRQFMFPRQLSAPLFVWLVEPVNGTLFPWDFQFVVRVPDAVHKLSLGLPRQSTDGVTMPSLSMWKRSSGPSLSQPAVGGTELALGASLKSSSTGQEVLLLAAGEDGQLVPVWQFWMLPGYGEGEAGGMSKDRNPRQQAPPPMVVCATDDEDENKGPDDATAPTSGMGDGGASGAAVSANTDDDDAGAAPSSGPAPPAHPRPRGGSHLTAADVRLQPGGGESNDEPPRSSPDGQSRRASERSHDSSGESGANPLQSVLNTGEQA